MKSKVFPSFSAVGKEYSNFRQSSYECLRDFQKSCASNSLNKKLEAYSFIMAQIWPDVHCTTERGQYKSVKWSSRLFFGQGKTKQTRFLTCVWGKAECFHFMIMFFQIWFPYIPFFFPFTTLFCFALFSFSTLLLWKAVRKEDIRALTIWRDLKLKKEEESK